MPTTSTTIDPTDINNPTKEIWANSGIFSGKFFGRHNIDKAYAVDVPNTNIINSGISVSTSSTTTTLSPLDYVNSKILINNRDLSSGNYFIDDMLIFNKYIHYAVKTPPVKEFNPQTFLEQSIVTFNIYSLEYR